MTIFHSQTEIFKWFLFSCISCIHKTNKEVTVKLVFTYMKLLLMPKKYYFLQFEELVKRIDKKSLAHSFWDFSQYSLLYYYNFMFSFVIVKSVREVTGEKEKIKFDSGKSSSSVGLENLKLNVTTKTNIVNIFSFNIYPSQAGNTYQV